MYSAYYYYYTHCNLRKSNNKCIIQRSSLLDFKLKPLFNIIVDLYLDPERKTYKALEYKKVSACSGFCSLLTKAGRSLNSKAKVICVFFNKKVIKSSENLKYTFPFICLNAIT